MLVSVLKPNDYTAQTLGITEFVGVIEGTQSANPPCMNIRLFERDGEGLKALCPLLFTLKECIYLLHCIDNSLPFCILNNISILFINVFVQFGWILS